MGSAFEPRFDKILIRISSDLHRGAELGSTFDPRFDKVLIRISSDFHRGAPLGSPFAETMVGGEILGPAAEQAERHDGLVKKQENSRGVIHCATQPVDRSLDIVLLFRAVGITAHWTMCGYGDTVRASVNLEVI